MDWEDEYDNGHDDIMDNTSQRYLSAPDETADGGLDPMDIANPVSACFFLSDDAQDEIGGRKGKNMKCLSCGLRFTGEIYDSCPECLSVNTDEAARETEGDYW